MVDPRVLHTVTVEMHTGFLLLAFAAALAKFLSDGYLKRFGGRLARIDRWARLTSQLGNPASYFALGAGIAAMFASMATGIQVWPLEDLLASNVVYNKVLVVIISQSIFVGAFIMRARYGKIWTQRGTSWLFVVLLVVGAVLMILGNSMAGHLAGKGSLLDDVLHYLRIDTHRMWLFPQWAVLPIAIAFPLAGMAFWLRLQRRRRGMVEMTAK